MNQLESVKLEEWKVIKGFENYHISNFGRVRSVKRNGTPGGIRKLNKNSRGYVQVSLRKDDKLFNKRVSILVAEAFIENTNNKTQVNHIDENKNNNYVSNLEWTTAKENANHGTRNERIAKKKSFKIRCIENNQIYNSCKECATMLNISRSGISNVLNNKIKQTGGYTFERILSDD